MEGGNLGRSDANPGDVAVVVGADDDFANDCPMVIPE